MALRSMMRWPTAFLLLFCAVTVYGNVATSDLKAPAESAKQDVAVEDNATQKLVVKDEENEEVPEDEPMALEAKAEDEQMEEVEDEELKDEEATMEEMEDVAEEISEDGEEESEEKGGVAEDLVNDVRADEKTEQADWSRIIRRRITAIGHHRICEHDTYELKCYTGRISIASANYGRTTRKVCRKGPMWNSNCRSHRSNSQVKQACNGKKRCSLFASNSVYGDPCGGTYKYLEVKYKCVKTTVVVPIHYKTVNICENHNRKITCHNGKLRIKSANYGRKSTGICRHSAMSNTNCVSHLSEGLVKKQCHNKKSCRLWASNSVYEDPCYGTYKYLAVKFACVRSGGVCSQIDQALVLIAQVEQVS